MKKCRICNTERPYKDFHKNNHLKDGHDNRCKPCKKVLGQRYYKENKDEIIAKTTDYYYENKERLAPIRKKWRKENKKAIHEQKRIYMNKRRKASASFRLLENLRRRVNSFLKAEDKSARTMDLVGCDMDTMKAHIESLFTEGMSWDNYGMHGWHLDHVTPCASFDLSDPEQQKRCFHYTNTQPLWALDNLIKGDRMPE